MSKIKNKIKVMLLQQHKLNKHIHPHWWTQGFRWDRALWIECAEAVIEYHPWEWWCTKQNDIESSKLEVIDVWHFGLSMLLRDALAKGDSLSVAIELLMDELEESFIVDTKCTKGHVECFEEMTYSAMSTKKFDLAVFNQLRVVHEMDFDELFMLYVDKSTLNLFRNDNGYRVGKYDKNWGRGTSRATDNEYLMQIKKRLDPLALDYPSKLYDLLSEAYKNLNGR